MLTILQANRFFSPFIKSIHISNTNSMKLQAINSNPKISFHSSSNSQFASKNIQNHPGSCSLLQNSNCKFSRININCYKPISISASYGGRESESGDDVTSAPAKALRRVLGSPGIHLGPACFDALSAKLVERAGFDLCFTTGMWVSLISPLFFFFLCLFCLFLFGVFFMSLLSIFESKK